MKIDRHIRFVLMGNLLVGLEIKWMRVRERKIIERKIRMTWYETLGFLPICLTKVCECKENSWWIIYFFRAYIKEAKKSLEHAKRFHPQEVVEKLSWSDKICVCDISKKENEGKTCYSSCITFILTYNIYLYIKSDWISSSTKKKLKRNTAEERKKSSSS